MSRSPRVFVACLALVGLTSSCKKDAPTAPAPVRSATPVPSDFVFNDFVPQAGGDPSTVADGGAEGGAALEPAGGGAQAVKLLNPGAEPRAARRYAFVKGKAERRTATIRVRMEQGGQSADQPSLRLQLALSPTAAGPQGATFEVKLAGVELADTKGIPPEALAQASAGLKGLAGLAGRFDLSSQGVLGELAFTSDPKMASAGAAEILPLVQQAVELMVPILPAEPVGVGAEWTVTTSGADQGLTVKNVTKYTLKDWAGDSGTVVAEITRDAPKQALKDQRAPAGATIELKAAGRYTFAARLDRIASKVDGDTKTTIAIEAPKDGKPTPVMTQTIVVQQELATPAGK